MIRKIGDGEADLITPLIAREMVLTEQEINSRISGENCYIYADKKVKAVAALGQPSRNPIGWEVKVWLYVEPGSRRKGIGGKLWNHMLPVIAGLKPAVLLTKYRSDISGSDSFFQSIGFKRWFSLDTLEYEGLWFPVPSLSVERYNDDYFNSLIEIINECFEELRRKNNIKPYKPYPAGFDEAAARREWLARKNDTFIFKKGGIIVGVGVIDGNTVDIIAVSSEFRRKGYGREITEFCFNELRKKGYGKRYISVLTNNYPARALYGRIGCRYVGTEMEAWMHWPPNV